VAVGPGAGAGSIELDTASVALNAAGPKPLACTEQMEVPWANEAELMLLVYNLSIVNYQFFPRFNITKGFKTFTVID